MGLFGRKKVIHHISYTYITDNAPLIALQNQFKAAQTELQETRQRLNADCERMRSDFQLEMAQNERQLQDFKATHDMQLEQNKQNLRIMVSELKAESDRKIANYQLEMRNLAAKNAQLKAEELKNQEVLEKELQSRREAHQVIKREEDLRLQAAAQVSAEEHSKAALEVQAERDHRQSVLDQMEDRFQKSVELTSNISKCVE